MSGVTVAVGPTPARDDVEQAVVGGVLGSLRVIELQLVAFIMVFSASGLVPLVDIVFPAVATAYLLTLSRLSFPIITSPSQTQQQRHGSMIIISSRGFSKAYVVAGTTVGLFLPLAYVLGGFARGDAVAVKSTTPHLFMLSFQILTENVVAGLSLFSPPVRAFVPLIYTVRRIFLLFDWTAHVWFHNPHSLPPKAQLKDVAWYWFGRYLAIINLVYFSVNLFAFLIPKFLPRAFEIYFRDKLDHDVHAKMSHDRSVSSQPTNLNKVE